MKTRKVTSSIIYELYCFDRENNHHIVSKIPYKEKKTAICVYQHHQSKVTDQDRYTYALYETITNKILLNNNTDI